MSCFNLDVFDMMELCCADCVDLSQDTSWLSILLPPHHQVLRCVSQHVQHVFIAAMRSISFCPARDWMARKAFEKSEVNGRVYKARKTHRSR